MVKKVNGSATPTTKGKKPATTTPVAPKMNGKAKKDSSSSSDSSSDEEMPLAPGDYCLIESTGKNTNFYLDLVNTREKTCIFF